MEQLKAKYDDFFINFARPIIEHEEYQKMKNIPHHYGSVFDHCLDVAYYSYRLASRFRLDVKSTIRGALLHDFYLYKFSKRKNRNLIAEGFRHSRNHPIIAFQNASKYFELNEKETDIICNHMFPVGLPRSQEAWITTFADKVLAIKEYSLRVFAFVRLKYCSLTLTGTAHKTEF